MSMPSRLSHAYAQYTKVAHLITLGCLGGLSYHNYRLNRTYDQLKDEYERKYEQVRRDCEDWQRSVKLLP